MPNFIDLLMGLFRGAVFQHGRKQPIDLNGPLSLLNGPFSDLNGPFPRMPSWAVFPLENPLDNSPFIRRVSGVSNQSFLRLRRLFRDCVGHFLDPRAGRPPGDSFGDSFKGRAGSQSFSGSVGPFRHFFDTPGPGKIFLVIFWGLRGSGVWRLLPRSSFPCIFGIPCFFPLQGIPCCLERFSLLSQKIGGSPGKNNPWRQEQSLLFR